ncbi:MAG: hypothetical protein ACI4AB_09260 [Acetatifactor sp.]
MEDYELPVKFTEEERAAYAVWGIKKEKVLVPFGIAAAFIYLLAAVCIVTRVWGVRKEDHLWFQIIVQSGWMEELCYILAVIMTILILGPLNRILDRIWKKPAEPEWLRIKLLGDSVRVSKLQGIESNRISAEETHLLSELPALLDADKNAICFQGKWIKIGENTIENIYPPGKQHPWMDCPKQKASGISSVKRVCDILKGYEASLEETRREQEWIKENGSCKT